MGNFDKSNIYYIHTLYRRQHRISRILGCRIAKLPATYLGMPMFMGRMLSSLWNLMINLISKNLSSWKGCLLIQVGKAQLVQATLSEYSHLLHFGLSGTVQGSFTSSIDPKKLIMVR